MPADLTPSRGSQMDAFVSKAEVCSASPDRSLGSGPPEDQGHIPFFIFPQGLTRGSGPSTERELVNQWCSRRSTGLLKITWFLAAGQGPLTVSLGFPLQC